MSYRMLSAWLIAALCLSVFGIAMAAERVYLETQRIDESSVDSPYGWSILAVNEDTLIAGDPYDDDQGDSAGAVHVFKRIAGSWKYDQKVTHSTSSGKDYFGRTVALDGDWLAVSESRSFSEGFVYLFELKDGKWEESATLTASLAGDVRDSFGHTLAFSDDLLIVGSSGIRSSSVSPRAPNNLVHVFRLGNDGWVEEAVLSGDYDSSYGNYGYALAVEGNRIVVGDSNEHIEGLSWAGAAYVYDYDGVEWLRSQKLTASDLNVKRYFGSSLALDGDALVIGAPGGFMSAGSFHIIQAENNGAAYLFEKGETGWQETTRLEPEVELSYRELYGYSVAIEGNLIAISAPGRNEGKPGQGAVFIFESIDDQWQEHSRVLGSDSVMYLGLSTAVSGDRVIAGADAYVGEYEKGFPVVSIPETPVAGNEQILEQLTDQKEDESGGSFGGSLNWICLLFGFLLRFYTCPDFR